MSWQYDTEPRILVAAPPTNTSIISNAGNISEIDDLRARVEALEAEQTTIITDIATVSATAEAAAAASGASTETQTIAFTSANANAIINFVGVSNTTFNVGGTPVGPTTLFLDLSATGIEAANSTALAPSFQNGFLQIIWPTTGGITHTVQVDPPFILTAGGTTIDMTATSMIIRQYVIAPVSGTYPTSVAVQLASRAVYII